VPIRTIAAHTGPRHGEDHPPRRRRSAAAERRRQRQARGDQRDEADRGDGGPTEAPGPGRGDAEVGSGGWYCARDRRPRDISPVAARRPLLRDPGGDLDPRVEPELVPDGLDVPLGGALGDEEAGCDLPVAQALGDEVRDLPLAAAEAQRQSLPMDPARRPSVASAARGRSAA